MLYFRFSLGFFFTNVLHFLLYCIAFIQTDVEIRLKIHSTSIHYHCDINPWNTGNGCKVGEISGSWTMTIAENFFNPLSPMYIIIFKGLGTGANIFLRNMLPAGLHPHLNFRTVESLLQISLLKN